MTATRGTTNGNARGSSYSRARRRAWLLATYAANVQVIQWRTPESASVRLYSPTSVDDQATQVTYLEGVGLEFQVLATCRCFRCGCLLVDGTLTVDRIIPGRDGGTYRRNNIRPACGGCNSETGGALAHRKDKP